MADDSGEISDPDSTDPGAAQDFPLPPTFSVVEVGVEREPDWSPRGLADRSPSATLRPLGWSLFVLGGMAITSGAGVMLFGYMPTVKERDKSFDSWKTASGSQADQYEEEARAADDKAYKMNVAGWALLGGGAAIFATSIIILVVNHRRASDLAMTDSPDGLSWSVGGVAMGRSGAVALNMGW
ncbi:MAG: hypothetical protein PHU25_17205 [Deltaproteobacteria bacterium]|nr:hypothetical protein [Deltaproteobacteria bacterium]